MAAAGGYWKPLLSVGDNSKMDLFSKDDFRTLFKNKKVVIVGDSVYRAIYKDLILALQEDRLLSDTELKKKAEPAFPNPKDAGEDIQSDKLIFRTHKSNGQDFIEIREFQSVCGFYLIQFYFVTRCYYLKVEAMLNDFREEPPDIVIMNSCLWDTTRYGSEEQCVEDYLKNMNILLTRLYEILPKTSIFLWCTCLPLATKFKSGFTLNEEYVGHRFKILEANFKVAQIVTSFGFDVLDLHYYMRSLLKHRSDDGVHWNPWANRHITQLIMSFLLDTYGLPIPSKTVQKIVANNKCVDVENALLFRSSVEGIPKYVEYRKKDLAEEAVFVENKS